MDKRSVYVDLAQDYVNLLEEQTGDYCCYNYTNEEQQTHGCENKDCDECKKKYFDEIYEKRNKKYDNAK